MVEALQKGFELKRANLSVPRCEECRNSGGKCGCDRPRRDFACQCPDWSSLTSCHATNRSIFKLTEKSDVYSFGVVLIELMSSLPAVDIMRCRHEINLSSLAINKIHANALNELVDANLGFEYDDSTREMIVAASELAFRCLQPRCDDRPPMQEVLQTLKQIRKCGRGDGKAKEGGDPSDYIALLKNDSRTFSLDSVIVTCDTTSNSSGMPNESAKQISE